MEKTVLVTGISGFIAKHVALALLRSGYRVRGTVRDLAKAGAVRATLSRHADVAGLEFVAADLGSDDGWAAAMRDIWGVAHLASPFPLVNPKDESELVRPAVEGTLRVLEHAVAANVARFVQTSSNAAIYPGHPRSRTAPFNEDDWSELDGPGVNAYEKSKTLAERAARDLVARKGGTIHFSTVNPALVLGPALDADIGTSAEVIRMILRGAYPGMPRVWFGIIDVRDVAEMHLRALETSEPSGGRYSGVAEAVSFIEMSRMLREGLGADGRKAPRWQLPDFVVRLVGLFDPAARTIIPQLGWELRFDSSRTQKALGMTFRPARDAVVAMGRSLVDLKLL